MTFFFIEELLQIPLHHYFHTLFYVTKGMLESEGEKYLFPRSSVLTL